MKITLILFLVTFLCSCDPASQEALNREPSPESYLGVNTGNSLVTDLHLLIDGVIADSNGIFKFNFRSDFDCSYNFNAAENEYETTEYIVVYRRQGSKGEMVGQIDITDLSAQASDFFVYDALQYRLSCLVELRSLDSDTTEIFENQPVRLEFSGKPRKSGTLEGDDVSPSQNSVSGF